MHTNLAISICIYLQWSVVEDWWSTPHVFPFQPQIHSRSYIPGQFGFYRATPMHSADYAVARLCRLSVHPSVCHTPVFSQHH